MCACVKSWHGRAGLQGGCAGAGEGSIALGSCWAVYSIQLCLAASWQPTAPACAVACMQAGALHSDQMHRPPAAPPRAPSRKRGHPLQGGEDQSRPEVGRAGRHPGAAESRACPCKQQGCGRLMRAAISGSRIQGRSICGRPMPNKQRSARSCTHLRSQPRRRRRA